MTGSAQAELAFGRGIESGDTVGWYLGTPFFLPVNVGSEWEQVSSSVGGLVRMEDGRYRLKFRFIAPGLNEIIVVARAGSRTTDIHCYVVVEKPALIIEARRQPFARVLVGGRYQPESMWKSTWIPPDQYLTTVRFDDDIVFERRGTQYNCLPSDDFVVPALTTRVTMTVDWLPFGDPDWRVPILSTDPALHEEVSRSHPDGVHPPLVARYRSPYIEADSLYTYAIGPNGESRVVGSFRVWQPGGRTGDIETIGVSCEECAAYGLGQLTVHQVDDSTWSLTASIVSKRQLAHRWADITERGLSISIEANGLHGTSSVASTTMKVEREDRR